MWIMQLRPVFQLSSHSLSDRVWITEEQKSKPILLCFCLRDFGTSSINTIYFLIWLSFWTCHAVSETVLFTHFGVTPSTYDKQQGSMRNYKPLRPPLAMNPFCYRLVLCSSTRFPLFCVFTHCSKYVITVQIQSHLARQSRLAPFRLKQVQPTPCCHFRFLLLPCGITQLINQPCVKMLLRATNPNSQYDVRRWIHSNAVSGHFVLIA